MTKTKENKVKRKKKKKRVTFELTYVRQLKLEVDQGGCP